MLPSMGPIMSSMPILDPVPEPMDTDIPSEEVLYYVVCVCVYFVVLLCAFSVMYCVYCGVQGGICADFDVFQDVVISNVSVC